MNNTWNVVAHPDMKRAIGFKSWLSYHTDKTPCHFCGSEHSKYKVILEDNTEVPACNRCTLELLRRIT